MVEAGEADAMVAGIEANYAEILRPVLQVVGPAEGVRKVAGLYMVAFPQPGADVPGGHDREHRARRADAGGHRAADRELGAGPGDPPAHRDGELLELRLGGPPGVAERGRGGAAGAGGRPRAGDRRRGAGGHGRGPAQAQGDLSVQPPAGPGERADLLAAVGGERRLQAPGPARWGGHDRPGPARDERSRCTCCRGVARCRTCSTWPRSRRWTGRREPSRFRGSPKTHRGDVTRMATQIQDPLVSERSRMRFRRPEGSYGLEHHGLDPEQGRSLESLPGPALRGGLRLRRRPSRAHGRPVGVHGAAHGTLAQRPVHRA